MDYQASLKQLNSKYYPIISDKYGSYIKNFHLRRNLATNVFLIPQKYCFLCFSELAYNKRGKTPRTTGNIYIRKEAFSEHLLVHEYIHRLSINVKHIRFIKLELALGFCIDADHYYYLGLNELLTEWITYSITGIQEDTIYFRYLYVIDEFREIIGEQQFQEVIFAYFHNDILLIENIIKTYSSSNPFDKLQELTNIIFFQKLGVEFHLI